MNGLITIDRSKFLLFSADSVKGNPEGKSVLKSVYLPYKQLSLLKDQLMLGVSKDIASVPVVYIPPKYMAARCHTSGNGGISSIPECSPGHRRW
jgi:hypothetical protein